MILDWEIFCFLLYFLYFSSVYLQSVYRSYTVTTLCSGLLWQHHLTVVALTLAEVSSGFCCHSNILDRWMDEWMNWKIDRWTFLSIHSWPTLHHFYDVTMGIEGNVAKSCHPLCVKELLWKLICKRTLTFSLSTVKKGGEVKEKEHTHTPMTNLLCVPEILPEMFTALPLTPI